MTDQDIRSRAREIIEKAVNGVLITLDEHGFPHPRTMWTASVSEDFTIYFVTGRLLAKCRQIEANPKVCVFWTEVDAGRIGWDYAHVKGEATITDDQALRDRFWSDELSQYFPDGRTDANYVVIVLKPRQLMLMDSHKYPLDIVSF